MCTVTWLRGRDAGSGYELFFNRDEMRTRTGESGPAVKQRDGRRYIAPRDGDCGGSWIAVNEFGVSVALLNGYRAAEAADREYRSRGLLLTDLADARNLDEVVLRVEEADLHPYRSFVVLVLDPERAAAILEWDGTSLAVELAAEDRSPLISSAIRSPEVRMARAETYAILRPPQGEHTSATLRAYHASHRLGPSSHSVCMHRDDAATRSLSHVTVGPDAVHFAYAPDAPCRTEMAEPVSLPLRNSSPTRR